MGMTAEIAAKSNHSSAFTGRGQNVGRFGRQRVSIKGMAVVIMEFKILGRNHD
jgi:hypothetical protein